MTSDIDSLKERAVQVLKHAADLGASQAEVSASSSAGLSVTARLGDVETLEFHRDQGMAITVYLGSRKGSASTSDLSAAALHESVGKACALAKFGAEDEFSGLADPDRLARDVPDLDLHHAWPIEAPEAIDIAVVCEAAGLESDQRITNSEGATVSTHSGCRVYGNSHGFLAGYDESQHSVSCAMLASTNGQMERDHEYTLARNPAALDDAAEVGRQAAQRAITRLNPRKLDTLQTAVLYPARIARGLFGHLLGAISGGSQYRKATFLHGAVGQQIMAEHITIDERPHIKAGLSSAPFDAEGVATDDRTLVDRGTLSGYVLASYYARKLGLATTGNAGGVHNLVVSDTGQDFDALVNQMNTGFLVTELMGHGVNIVTGDYSRGAAGFWVENGEIQFPVSEVTVAGNLAQMYKNIVAVGNDTDFRGGIRTGSVLVEGMTVAGN